MIDALVSLYASKSKEVMLMQQRISECTCAKSSISLSLSYCIHIARTSDQLDPVTASAWSVSRPFHCRQAQPARSQQAFSLQKYVEIEGQEVLLRCLLALDLDRGDLVAEGGAMIGVQEGLLAVEPS
jgi:hypothetical protein